MDTTTQKPPQVNVINPSGELVSIPETQLNEALTYGYQMAGKEELSEFKNDEEFGHGAGNAAKAFAAGAARGVTFGGSDYVLTKAGLVDRETLDQLKKRNPGWSATGELAGIAGSLALAPETLALKGAASALKAAEATGDLARIAEATRAFDAAKTATQTLKASDALNPVYGLSKVGQKVTQGVLPQAAGVASLVANPETRSLANQVLSQAGAHAIGSGIEGAAYGLGNSVSEASLGDPKLISEGIMGHVGYSALMGGAFGGIIGGSVAGLKGIKGSKITPEIKHAAMKDAVREEVLNTPPSQSMQSMTSFETQGGLNSEYAPKVETPPVSDRSKVTTFDQIAERVRNTNLPNTLLDLPQKQALIDATGKLPDLEFPVLKLQLESLENKQSRDKLSTFLDLDMKEAKDLGNYQAYQKAEGVSKTHQTIEQIAQNRPLTSDPLKAGDQVVQSLRTQYEAEKKALTPQFKAFDEIAIRPLSNFSATVAPIEEAIEGASKALSVKDGKLVLEKYSETMPFTKRSYEAADSLVKAANRENLTLGELRNVRESMRDLLNDTATERDFSQIGRLQKTVMDYMEKAVSEVNPHLEVRETFKRYRINESNRAKMEKILGGHITDRMSKSKLIRNEDVLKNIFRDSVSTQTSKEVMSQEAFDTATANYIKHMADQVTDPGKNGFSSFRFYSELSKKDVELGIALAEKPQLKERLEALTNFMRILPDAPSSNPSGTAKTLDKLGLIDSVRRLGDLLHPIDSIKKIVGEQAEKAATKAEQQKIYDVMKSMLEGKSVEEAERQAEAKMVQYSILAQIERMAQKAKNEINHRANQIFNFTDKNTENLSGIGAGKLTPEEKKKKFEKTAKDLQSLNNNPEVFMNALDKATITTFVSAPQITAGLSQAAASATQFLASKLPVEQNAKPLSKPLPPSQADIAKFSRYQEILEKPALILSHVKNGTLTVEHLETLHVNYPKLLDHMRSEVIEKLTAHMSKKDNFIPYKTKLSLSAFLGSDLDRSLDPQFMFAAQKAIAQAGQSQEQAQAQAKGSSQPGKLDQAGRMLTPMQANAMRT